MLITKTFYSIKCDKCGKYLWTEERDSYQAHSAAKKKNWTVSVLGDYCPQCLNQIVKEAENDE